MSFYINTFYNPYECYLDIKLLYKLLFNIRNNGLIETNMTTASLVNVRYTRILTVVKWYDNRSD